MDFDNLSNDEDFRSSFSTANSVNATLTRPSLFSNIDPDVVSIMSSLNATLTSPTQAGTGSRLYGSSSYAGSEAESDRLSNPFSGLNKDSLSVISAPYLNNRGVIKHNLFGSASIAGHVITQLSPFDNGNNNGRLPPLKTSNFLEKFGSVADRTRDLENGLLLLNIDDSQLLLPSERRTSFLSNDQLAFNTVNSNSPNSLHEALNSSRHQSVSDRIDSYQQEQERRLSFSSEVIASDNGSTTADQQQQIKHNIWNPASAHTFQPATSNQFMPSLQPPMFFGGNPANPMFPNMYSPFPYQQPPPLQNSPQPQTPPLPYPVSFPSGAGNVGSMQSKSPLNEKESPQPVKLPGVNMLNRAMSPPAFMMQPFIPYGMFPSQSYSASPSPMAPQLVSDDKINPSKESFGALNKNSGKKSPHSNKTASLTKNPRSRNGPPFIQRSPLLEEFRANASGKEYRLSDIYGHGVEFSKDQHGSRFIQAQLSKSMEQEKEVIFNEIRDVAYELMSDVFGNYVIQKYFEHGNDVQRKVLLESMDSHIRELSLQMYGCRVIQRAIEHIDLDQKLKLILELNDSQMILACCKDANGNHVIQKAIELIPSKDISFIFESIKDQVYHLSTNSFGCRVIQKLLEFGDVKQCEFIVSVLEKYVDVLLVDKFGNYVIQYILTNESNCDTDKIINIVNDTITKDFTKLSANKFSSNVVESFITTTPLSNRLDIKKQTLEDNNNNLIRMINDPYGNYVVQKLVTVDIDRKDEITRQFVDAIRDYLDDAGNTNSKLSIEKLRNIIKSI